VVHLFQDRPELLRIFQGGVHNHGSLFERVMGHAHGVGDLVAAVAIKHFREFTGSVFLPSWCRLAVFLLSVLRVFLDAVLDGAGDGDGLAGSEVLAAGVLVALLVPTPGLGPTTPEMTFGEGFAGGMRISTACTNPRQEPS
jgi:hypothetical protein